MTGMTVTTAISEQIFKSAYRPLRQELVDGVTEQQNI